ncbi:MAG TPA: hypothetical protein VHF92_01975 [Geodermatophilus sp.]|nr:hypothetical protein [Geodermatophilus sp.]
MDDTVARELHRECVLMLRHLMANGRKVPPGVVAKVAALGDAGDDAAALRTLAGIHGELAGMAAPATPRSLRTLESEAQPKSVLRFLGPVRLARQLASTAFFFLAAITAIEVLVGHNTRNLFHFDDSPGWVDLLFLAACAGLGATFAALFRVHCELASSSYRSDTEATYWSQIILGIVAGLVLAEFLTEAARPAHSMSRPVLAVIGGFSGVVVNSILNRLVESVEQLFGGSRDKVSDEIEQRSRERSAQAVAETRLQLAGELFRIQRQLDAHVPTATVRRALSELIDSLLPTGPFGAEDISWTPSQPAPAAGAATANPQVPVKEQASRGGENVSA